MLAEEIAMPLPIDAETFDTSVTIPVPILKGIWKKAEKLIATASDYISSAPGHSAVLSSVLNRNVDAVFLCAIGLYVGSCVTSVLNRQIDCCCIVCTLWYIMIMAYYSFLLLCMI